MQIGDSIYRIVKLDTGENVPQELIVTDIGVDCFACKVTDNDCKGFIVREENITWFSTRGSCNNACAKLNGYYDAFDYYCIRNNIEYNDREIILEMMMHFSGIYDYEQFCNICP